MELREYLDVLRRRWRLVLVPVLLASAVVGLTVASTPTYKSTAIMYARTPGEAAATSTITVEQRLNSYVQLVKERRLARAVDAELAMPETVKEVQDKLTARAESGALLVSITAEDSSPERAQQIAATAVEKLDAVVSGLEARRSAGGAGGGPGGGSVPPVDLALVQDASLGTANPVGDGLRAGSLAAALGLFLGILLALVREALDSSVRSAQEVLGDSPAGGLVQIPYVRQARRNPGAALAHDPEGPLAESFRRLRVRLFPPGHLEAPRSLLVTSSTPDDGTTSTAGGLAITLAEGGLRVALVAADAHGPAADGYLGLANRLGLSDVVVRNVPVDDALQPWGERGLQVLTPGSEPAAPSELLRADGMSALIKQLEHRFDVVVVDAPPLLTVTETAVLSTAASGVVLTVRYGRTRRESLREAAALLAEVGAVVVVDVLTMVPPRTRHVFRSSRARSRRWRFLRSARSASRHTPPPVTGNRSRMDEPTDPSVRVVGGRRHREGAMVGAPALVRRKARRQQHDTQPPPWSDPARD